MKGFYALAFDQFDRRARATETGREFGTERDELDSRIFCKALHRLARLGVALPAARDAEQARADAEALHGAAPSFGSAGTRHSTERPVAGSWANVDIASAKRGRRRARRFIRLSGGLTENFRRPYFAVSVTDFWHRWHISLSTWLKDCVYIPLGGSRCSRVRNYWNIFVTFLVSGIWHGANWTFVVWGIMHGICQIIEKMLGEQRCRYGLVGKTVKIIITFLIVNFAWIFFRMPSLGDACRVIGRIFDPSLPMSLFLSTKTDLLLMVMGVGMLFLKDFLDEYRPGRYRLLDNPRPIVRWLSALTVMVLILLTGVFGADQFIYANF